MSEITNIALFEELTSEELETISGGGYSAYVGSGRDSWITDSYNQDYTFTATGGDGGDGGLFGGDGGDGVIFFGA